MDILLGETKRLGKSVLLDVKCQQVAFYDWTQLRSSRDMIKLRYET